MLHEEDVVAYAAVSVASAVIAMWVLLLFVRARSDRRSMVIERRRSWIWGLVLIALGAVFYLVGAIDPPGADLGEDLEFAAAVDSLGGGFVATGYTVGALLVSFLLLGAVDPIRAGRLLVRTGIGAVPFVAVLTTLTAVFDRGEWSDSNIGPLMGSVFFFALPAVLAGELLLRTASPPTASRAMRSTLRSG